MQTYGEDTKKLRQIIKELLALCRESNQWWLLVAARKIITKFGYRE